MKRFAFPLFLLAFAGLAHAVQPQDPEVIRAMTSELIQLHETGVALHDQLDPAKKNQVAACQAEHGKLPDQARALRERAAKLPVLAYRVNLTMAANDAISCVTCDSDGSACDSIPPALERIQHQLDTPVEDAKQAS